MRIDAITCCTGEAYADLLEQSLHTWLDTLDSLTIVTKESDTKVRSWKAKNLQIVTTDVFTLYGAHLNKAAALDYAYAASDPTDWVLHFDSDISPPSDWRDNLEEVRSGKLYGVTRLLENGESGDKHSFWPFGYFQLWHSGDPKTWKWPIFDPWHPHCGSYDADFAELWGRNWQRLPFTVDHIGKPRTNWFGTDKTQLMKPLLKQGLYKYRISVKRGVGRLRIPQPKLRLHLNSLNERWVRDILRFCMDRGPFAVYAQAGKKPASNWESIDERSCEAEVLTKINRALKDE